MHNWETDPRPFTACLREWQVSINGGRDSGARPAAARELRTPLATYEGWASGRPCRHEAAIRRLMTLIDRAGADR